MMIDAPATVQAILARITRVDPTGITDTHTLSALGLDSLDRVILAVRLEEAIGRPISDRALIDARTVADLAALLTPAAEANR
jgi:acyl carrier protein